VTRPGLDPRGVIPANLLPLDEDLQIDEPAYRAHLQALATTEGVTALTCNGHASEVGSMTRDERRRALAIAVDAVGDAVPIIAGAYAEDHRQAGELARDAVAEGADALLVFPPPALAFDAPAGTAHRHFAAIAEAVTLPLVVFVYPTASGLSYDAATLADICTITSVVAVKDWSLDIRAYERNLAVVRSADHPISMLTSFSTNLLPSLIVGADGILSGHGSVIAALQAHLLAAVAAHRLDEARAVYARIQVLTDVVYRAPMGNAFARMKEQLVMLGLEMTPAVRPPLVPVEADERGELRQALVEADLVPVGVG
jgi:4-hydroxy-tetrahydrodipicolinate synthase